jgi:hypothetical protein
VTIILFEWSGSGLRASIVVVVVRLVVLLLLLTDW